MEEHGLADTLDSLGVLNHPPYKWFIMAALGNSYDKVEGYGSVLKTDYVNERIPRL